MERFEVNQIINIKKNAEEYIVSNILLKIFFYIFSFTEIILNVLTDNLISIINIMLKLNFTILQVLILYLLLKNKYRINKEFVLFLGLSYFTLLKINESYFYMIFFIYLGYILIKLNLKIKIIKNFLTFLFLTFLLKWIIEKKMWILSNYYFIFEKKFNLLIFAIILIMYLFLKISKFNKLNIKIYLFIVCGVLFEILFKDNMSLSNIYEICIESFIIYSVLVNINLFDFFIKTCCRYSVLNKN